MKVNSPNGDQSPVELAIRRRHMVQGQPQLDKLPPSCLLALEDLHVSVEMRAVEIADVWERFLELVRAQAQPLGHWQHHTLPRILRNQSAAAKLVFIVGIGLQVPREVVVDLPTIHCTTKHEVLTGIAVIAASPIGIERSGELGVREEDNPVPDILRLHLAVETLEGLVHLSELDSQVRFHVAVHVPTTSLDEEEIALGSSLLVNFDESRHGHELPFQLAGITPIRKQCDTFEGPAKYFCGLDGLFESLCELFGVRVPMALLSQLSNGVPQLSVLIKATAIDAQDLAVCDLTLRPDGAPSQGE